MQRLIIKIPAIPPSVNHYWKARGKRRFLTKKAREWKRLVADVCRSKLPKNYKPLSGRLRVKINLCVRHRRGDVDNRVKAIFDALNGLVWVDDRQVDDFRVIRKFAAREKTVVIVEVVEDEV